MNLKLGSKIGAGFGVLIVIAMILGGMAVLNMSRVGGESNHLAYQYLPEVKVSNQLERGSLLTMYAIRGYALSEDKAYLAQGRKELESLKAVLAKAKDLAAKYPALVKLRQSIEEAEAGMTRYDQLVSDTERADAGMDSAREAMDAGAKEYVEACLALRRDEDKALARDIAAGAAQPVLRRHHRMISLINEIIDLGNNIRVANFKSQAKRDEKLMRATLGRFAEIDSKLGELEPLVQDPAGRQNFQAVHAGADAYDAAMNKFLANWTKLGEVGRLREAAARRVLTVARKTAEAGLAHTQDVADRAASSLSLSTWIMLVGLGVALVLGIIIAWVITRGITRPVLATGSALQAAAAGDFTFHLDQAHLKRGDEIGEMLRDVQKMADNLSHTVREATLAAETVASSSSEISQGNQDLSNRTQQQASAIEETASAIEEMTSSVKQNANNSQQANQLVKKTAEMAREGGEVVQKTVQAMQAVTESSKKIADIINVVNEIAFQTNLLALNAAVEAARAGEAGRGFAVVAGEVRNLAGRSASAAKEIQGLITDSVGKVEQGNDLVGESGRLLDEIIENVQNVADTMAEINAASQEQAQGIDEINRAVAQMDEAVQQNAALVEEAASASENTAAAAEELRSQMAQFKVESGPASSRTLPPPPPKAAKPAAKPAQRPKPAAKPAEPKKLEQKPEAKKQAAAKKEDDFFEGVDLEGFEEF